MKNTLLRSLLLLGLMVGNASCPTSAIAQPSPSEAAQQPAVQPPTAQVKLLNPGKGDRQVLRFKPTVGTRQVSLMSFDQTLTLAMMGQEMPAVVAPMVTSTIEVVVTKVEANGDVHYQVRYLDVDVVAKPGTRPEMLDVMRSQLKVLQAMSGDFVMSDRGQVKSGRFELPDQADPILRSVLEQFSQSMHQISLPLPETAIGVGAQWQTTVTMALAGMNLTQMATYELASFSNNVATLKIQMAQQAPPQMINAPGLPTTAKIQLKKLQSEGQGQSTLDLGKPFVQQSTLSLQSTSHMSVQNAKMADELDMTTQSTIQITFQPK